MDGKDPVRTASPVLKLTYDDFVQFPDDGKRHELIDGEHYVTPSPSIAHQRISGRLYLLIGNWLEEHPVGQLFYAPLDVIFQQCSSTTLSRLRHDNGPQTRCGSEPLRAARVGVSRETEA
jgi:hypothetical protein